MQRNCQSELMRLILIGPPPKRTENLIALFNPKPEQARMKFYTETHRHYCGIDLHTKNLYVCLTSHSMGVIESLMGVIESFLMGVIESLGRRHIGVSHPLGSCCRTHAT